MNNPQTMPALRTMRPQTTTKDVRVLPSAEAPHFFREFNTKMEFVQWKQELYGAFAKND